MADRIVVMNHGAIEQVGTPFEIYAEPTTAFVADFIGTMNFLPGRLVASDRVRVGRLELRCPPRDLAPERLVTLSIRPEDILVQDVEVGAENAFEAEIAGIEFLGAYVRARLQAPQLCEGELRADLSANVVRRLGLAEGRRVPFGLPRARLRIYPRD